MCYVPGIRFLHQYIRVVCANFFAEKSHPARKTRFDADMRQSSAIHEVKMRLKTLANRPTVTISASKTTQPANSKSPYRNWCILDFYGTILG
jgi:hypothetical protein